MFLPVFISCSFSCFVPFAIIIRPYGKITIGEIHRRGDLMYVWWFSPHRVFVVFVVGLFFVIHVGEIHRVAVKYTLVLPSVYLLIYIHVSKVKDVGEIHRSEYVIVYTLVLPSMNRKNSCGLCFNFTCRGDSQESKFLTSRSPPVILSIMGFEHFEHFTNLGPQVMTWYIIGVAVPLYICIYSLRHFLTTKGALIDGDGYPPLPPLK